MKAVGIFEKQTENMLNNYTKICICIVISLIVFLLGCFTGSKYIDKPEVSEVRDTVTIRDTVEKPVPVPEIIDNSRIDTCWLTKVVPDTSGVKAPLPDSIPVEVPIETKVYETEDYKAVIEGYRANLLDIDIYRQTQYITTEKTVTRQKRWNFTVGPQVGYGWTPAGGQPYVGVGVTFGYSF